eukprot:CAMPEP_0115868434 /NCGR_PEP_ID=MMETSP0287-20121206/21294_1 /TAXON_ID=412157 /ORGANISM="Chrysochromulina rotalis, Strain UIO044" /LENGTH=441 /DNA_ID=CAMNT_0003323095 /DNA_START=55 /DNA_END=1380 /DNA_ORIENTATION=+
MTIAYDASELVGWKALPKLFCRWNGTIFHGVFSTPMFWLVNLIHGALVYVPWHINEQRRKSAQRDDVDYEEFVLQPIDWGVSTVGMALLFFFMVFYNNNSYQRFYALYGHCVGVGATIMEWLALVKFSLPSDKLSQWNATRCILAAQHILYYSLHGEDFDDDEWQVIVDRNMLTGHEVDVLKKYSGFKPYLALTWALTEAQSQVENKMRTDESMNRDLGQGMREELLNGQFREVAFKFRGHCGQIINLLKEPVPFPYFHLLNVMLMMQLSITAYALAVKVEWQFSVIMMAIVSVVLLGMRGLAVQLSNPFGNDSVDFNLERFMKGSFTNAIEYLKEDSFKPSGQEVADANARNPLFPSEHELGVCKDDADYAWSAPNSRARKKLAGKAVQAIMAKRRARDVRADVEPPRLRAPQAASPGAATAQDLEGQQGASSQEVTYDL